MKIELLALTLFAIPSLLSAQETTCNCLKNFNETVAKTQGNYAGFPGKVNSKTIKSYNNLVFALKLKAEKESNPKRCFYLINEYIKYFKDKHFSLTYLYRNEAEKEVIIINENYFNHLNANDSNSLEGIWINPDSSITLGIKKFPGNEYKAIVLKSKDNNLPRGLIYFSLEPHQKGFLLRQYNVFNSINFYAQQRNGVLQLWNFALFGRILPAPMTTDEKLELATWKNNNNGLAFKQLTPQTSYIKIPTFFNNDSKIEKLVKTHDQAIRSSENLIIDLRGNGGGNPGWSYLLPYVMTNPIKQDDVQLRISQDNVKLKRREMESVVTKPLPPEMKKYFPEEYVAKLKTTYDELPTTNNPFYTIPGLTIPVDSVLTNPARVALITDELCGSSTEYFFHLMKQSKKTIRYGTNSVGMMDYEGPSTTTPLPCKDLILMIPVSKSSWTDSNPIDEIGFEPDVKLNMPKSKWIDSILNDLQK